MVEFEYEEVVKATENFSPNRLVGKGSHGSVYRGVLKDDTVVAIKKPTSMQLTTSKLVHEARLLSSLPDHNPHVVHLLGTSQDEHNSPDHHNNNDRPTILVIEFMPNGSLHDFLHDNKKPPPSWPKRVQIITWIARAVQFLHDSTTTKRPSIIHRDIKSANILFDSNWAPKLADFGLSVLYDELQSEPTRPSQPSGTMGYLDPCYTTPNELSTKIDVFSYGVVLLEIISGRKAIDVSNSPASVVEWAVPLIAKRKYKSVCDARVVPPKSLEGTIRQMLHVASYCVSLSQASRPSMGEIVKVMESCSSTICCDIDRVGNSVLGAFLRSLIQMRRRRRKMGKYESTRKALLRKVLGFGLDD